MEKMKGKVGRLKGRGEEYEAGDACWVGEERG